MGPEVIKGASFPSGCQTISNLLFNGIISSAISQSNYEARVQIKITTTKSEKNMRFHQFVGAFFLAALSGSTFGASTVYFCTDDKCSQNCGKYHTMNSDACIEGGPARSVYASESTGQALVLSPHAGCTCQSQCFEGHGLNPTLESGCNKLDGEYMSMRLIKQSCDKNNC